MAKKANKTKSPALVFVEHMWTNATKATGHSWERLNQSMRSAVSLAIDSGMRFAPGDFEHFAEHFRIGYWCLDDRGDGCWYPNAIKAGNATAYQAYEQWLGRKAFILLTDKRKKSRDRLYVGSRFCWEGEFVTVTSFADDQNSLTACSYHDTKGDDYSRKVKRRFTITHDDIRKYHADLKTPSSTD